MERHHQVLAGVLAVQLLIIAVLWLSDGGRADADEHRLVTVESSTVTAIEIDDRTDSVRIDRKDDGWVLPGEEPLPVEEAKVAGLLEKLSNAAAPWPVATSESSAERFEVTSATYQRRIRLIEGDTTNAELYFGTSPGFRKVHARVEGSTDVFAVTFANYEAPTKADEWLDKTLLQPAGTIRSVTRKDGYTLQSKDGAWVLADAGGNEVPNQDTARDLTSKLANLRVLGRAEAAPAADAQPVFAFDVDAEGGRLALQFYRTGDEGDFVVGSDRYRAFFRVSEYIGEALEIDRAGLLVVAAEEVEPAASE